MKSSNKLTESQRRSMGFYKPWTARVRDENEALPNQINKMAGVYVPPGFNIRLGGEDHLKYKSLKV